MRRVESISNDINEQLLERARDFTSFSIAIDGSKDISDVEQLVIWIRGVDNNLKITEEMLSLSPMYGKARGIDIFDEVQKALSKASLPVTKLSGVATDGAPSMLGIGSGFKGQFSRWLAANGREGVIWCHCIIHQEVLYYAKTLGLENVMKLIVDAVNFIRAKEINHREFKHVLKELDSEYGDVLYFTAVRWLSRGAVLKRVWMLCDEISCFMEEKGNKVPEFQNPAWLCDFAFLVDITTHLNSLNSALQGKMKLIHELFGTVCAFEAKLSLFEAQLSKNNFSHFSELRSMENPDGKRYTRIVSLLIEEFKTRFADFRREEQKIMLFTQPFCFDVQCTSDEIQLELLDLQANINLKEKFREVKLDEISKNVSILDFYKVLPTDTYPFILEHARRMASLFGSTYTCEALFSKMKYTKNRYRSNMTDEHLYMMYWQYCVSHQLKWHLVWIRFYMIQNNFTHHINVCISIHVMVKQFHQVFRISIWLGIIIKS